MLQLWNNLALAGVLGDGLLEVEGDELRDLDDADSRESWELGHGLLSKTKERALIFSLSRLR